jgi:hypothetical protein
MKNVFVSDLSAHFQADDCLFVVGLGFDLRGLESLKYVGESTASQAVGLLNPKRPDIDQLLHLELFHSLSSKEAQLIGLGSENLVEVVDELQSFLAAASGSYSTILVDITSISHELLVALIGLFVMEGLVKNVTLIYTVASQYSFNTEVDKKWLSRGVTEIRSVLGFPGLMLPSKSLHLIIMAGFEFERAAEVISRFEPAKLTIAHGSSTQSVSPEHYASNKSYVEDIQKFLVSRGVLFEDIGTFEFSCLDPYLSSQQILDYVSGLVDDNIILCPLNTKMSTVGAAIAGLSWPRMQICYAQAAEYNLDGYAKPGERIVLVSLEDFNISLEDF